MKKNYLDMTFFPYPALLLTATWVMVTCTHLDGSFTYLHSKMEKKVTENLKKKKSILRELI